MDDKNISNQKKKAPLGIKLVAILSIFFPYACLDFVILTSLPQENITFYLMLTPLPLLLLVPKIFTIFIAIMLWMGKNWARIAFIIFFVIITSLNLWIGLNWNHYFPFSFSLSANYDYVVEIVFSLFAIFYLIFDKKVKEFFKKQIVQNFNKFYMDDKNISNQKKKAPLGIKLVAIIPVIPVLLFLFFDVAMIIGPFLDSGDFWVSIVPSFFPVFTAFLIFTSAMLWKGKNWARIALIILYIIGIIFSLWTYKETPPNLNYFSLTGSVFSLPAIFYLIFNKKVKEFFKRQIV